MKITVTNNIALNGGDAAILLGMIKALKQRFGNDTEFIVTCTYPDICAQIYPDIRWRTVIGREADTTQFNHIRIIGRIARMLKHGRFYIAAYLRKFHIPFYTIFLNRYDAETLNEYASSDYIVSSGGTYLIEPYGIDAQYIDYRISLILGKPLVQYTQSMGPFIRKRTQDRLRWIFNRCHTILLRDQKSADNVLALCLKDPSIVHVVPDAAFALGDINAIMARTYETMNTHGKVAISVREWSYISEKIMPNYYRCIANAVMSLIDMGYQIHFISTCQGIPAYTDDNEIADKIIDLIPESYYTNIIKYDSYLSIIRIIELLQQMDFIIATRLHMSILGLISGTPVYPIAYEFKTIELYQSLGYNHVDTLETLEASTLCSSIASFIDLFTPIRRQEINIQVAEYIHNTMEAANLIK